MRRLLLLLAAAGILGTAAPGFTEGSASGCVEGSGVPKTEQRRIPSFDAVSIDGIFEVTLVVGKHTELTLTAEDNLLPHITTEVNGDALTITTGRSLCAAAPFQVRVGTQTLKALSSQGANDIRIEEVAGGTLDIVIEGSGNIHATGRAERLSVDIRGVAELRAEALRAENVRLDISGSGEVEVFASKTIHVNVSGIGTVGYHGRPAEVIEEISGIGEMIPR